MDFVKNFSNSVSGELTQGLHRLYKGAAEVQGKCLGCVG